MSAVRRLLRAEALRLRAHRSTAALLGAVAVLTAALVALTAGLGDLADLRGDDGLRGVLSVGGAVAYPAAYVLGVLGTAGEHRHGTVTGAVLAAPARWPVVAAKAVAYGLAGAVLGLVGFAVALAVGAPWLSARDAGIDLGRGLPWLVGLGSVAAAALYGVVGVGVAAAVRSQTAALAGGLAWILVLDVATVLATSEVGRWLPGGAALSLVRAGGDDDVLPMGGAAGLLAAYGLLLALVGAAALVRRRRLA